MEDKIKKCKSSKELAQLCLEQPGFERQVVVHESVDSALLRKLASHGDKYVRLLIAKSEKADFATLEKLASDHEVVVRESARLNLIFKRQDLRQSAQ